MKVCTECSQLPERRNLLALWEYRDFVRALIECVRNGTLVLRSADFALEEMLRDPLPGDIAVHNFECSHCGRLYSLSADTYHGSAKWVPESLPPIS
jgi:hypothetical protein